MQLGPSLNFVHVIGALVYVGVSFNKSLEFCMEYGLMLLTVHCCIVVSIVRWAGGEGLCFTEDQLCGYHWRDIREWCNIILYLCACWRCTSVEFFLGNFQDQRHNVYNDVLNAYGAFTNWYTIACAPSPQFMENVAARYDEEARAAGIYIVSACAFDCVPNDLGALLLQKTFNGELAYAESFVNVSNGEVILMRTFIIAMIYNTCRTLWYASTLVHGNHFCVVFVPTESSRLFVGSRTSNGLSCLPPSHLASKLNINSHVLFWGGSMHVLWTLSHIVKWLNF